MRLFDFFKIKKYEILNNKSIKKIKKIYNVKISRYMIKRMNEYPKLVDILLSGNISEVTINLLNTKENLPPKLIEEIDKLNYIDTYINDSMIKRMNEHPKLVDILLSGNVSSEMIYLLNTEKKLNCLPDEETLKFIEFFELDESVKKSLLLLNNKISKNDIPDDYQCCYVDLEEEAADFHNEIDSFVSNIKINLGIEKLTKIPYYSSKFILYSPKLMNKVVNRGYHNFITGNIELNKETIIQTNYAAFRSLNKSTIDKISNCKIVFSEDDLDYDIRENMQIGDEINYKLIKYNHLIYIIEKSLLDNEIKDKLLYKIKNMYVANKRDFDLEINDVVLQISNDLDVEEIQKLTKEFELNIDDCIKKEIEKPAFNAKYYVDELDIDNVDINYIIDSINSLSEDSKIIVLKDPRILKKLNIPAELDEIQSRKLIYLLLSRLSSTTRDFVSQFDFDVETFISDPYNDYKSTYDINPIIKNYGVFDELNEEIDVSIADLLGHDGIINCGYYKGKNILYTFENFFKKEGDEYHTRALGLLKYESGEQLIKELEKRNRDTTDMKIRQIEDGKYVVSENGLHRFTVLRFHYLLDCMKKEKSEEELRELYKIPVNITSKTNFEKTYCNYLIKKADPNISYVSFNCGDKDKINIYYYSGDKSKQINEENLFDLVRLSIDSLDDSTLLEIQNFYNNFSTFRNFIDMYVPNLIEKFDEKEKEGIKL